MTTTCDLAKTFTMPKVILLSADVGRPRSSTRASGSLRRSGYRRKALLYRPISGSTATRSALRRSTQRARTTGSTRSRPVSGPPSPTPTRTGRRPSARSAATPGGLDRRGSGRPAQARGRGPASRLGCPGGRAGAGCPGAAGAEGPASGRRAPATRPGALRDLVEEHLRKFPDTAFAPYQIGKVLTRSAGAVASALGKLVSLGTAQMATGKPRSCRLAIAPAPDAVGGPGTSAEATPRAVGRPAGTSSPAHQREDRLDEALATSSSRAMLRAARASRRCSGPRTADRTPA